MNPLLALGPLGLLIALHYKSLPFAWHIRLFFIAIKVKWRQSSFLVSPSSPRLSRSKPQILLDTLPIGKDVFEDSITESFHVGFDEGDFLGHLSNSCYPKNLDFCRMSYAYQRLAFFQRDGGWTALAAIQNKFKNEIPLLASYKVRVRVLGWDDKWFYVRSIFYTVSNKPTSGDKKNDDDADPLAVPNEKVHCESTSRHCFKYGRRTIPPWLVFVTAGYSPKGTKNPRANWERAEDARLALAARGKKPNLLAAWTKNVGTDSEEPWMRKEHWDMEGWDAKRQVDPVRISLSM